MKFNKWTLGLAALLVGITAQAQNINTNAPAGVGNGVAGTFVNSAYYYFTSFNTNFNFDGVKLEMSSGYKQVNGANAANELYAQYDFGASSQFDVMANFQFSGLGSAVNAAEAGFGYALISHYDTKIQLDLLGGWDSTKGYTVNGVNQGAGVIEPRIELKKKLTPNTFASTAISLPEYTIGKFNTQPSFYVGLGFTY